MEDRFERFSLALSEMYRDWHRIASAELEQYGLKGTHATYLAAMARYEEGITAPQLCEICSKDKADVSRMMNILIQRGMVIKKGGHQNRYGGAYVLTDQGREVADLVKRRSSLAAELAGQDLSDENREIFYEALESIVFRLREIAKNGLPQDDQDASQRKVLESNGGNRADMN